MIPTTRTAILSAVGFAGLAGCHDAVATTPAETPNESGQSVTVATVATTTSGVAPDVESAGQLPQDGCARASREGGVFLEGEERAYVLRSYVESTLESRRGFGMIRVMPQQAEDGRVTGVKLSGIRRDDPKNVLGRLGFENGDVLTAVNGFAIASPDKALEAYSSARNAERITVDVLRKDQRRTTLFRICN
jgi:S1-C subfamily serine protease